MKAKVERINKDKESELDYWFLLQCMGALAAVGAVAAITYSCLASSGPAMLATAAVAGSMGAAPFLPFLIPIAAILLLIAAACTIPFMSCGSAVISTGYSYPSNRIIVPNYQPGLFQSRGLSTFHGHSQINVGGSSYPSNSGGIYHGHDHQSASNHVGNMHGHR